MSIYDLGRVTPVLKGAYNALTSYTRLDIVTQSGSSYICKEDSLGNDPTNTTYWALLAQAGDFAGTATAVCGENLFHNWDFKNAINQRAVSGTVSSVGYFYDRWMLNSGAVTIGSSYLTFASGAEIEQRIETHLLAGKEVTVTVHIGNVYISGTSTFPIAPGTAVITLTNFGTATIGYHADYMFVRLTANNVREVLRVKLELGTVSTLNRQPPMDAAAELPKCQRFFYNAGLNPQFPGRAVGTANLAGCTMSIPVVMRATPTISSEATVIYSNGTELTGTSFTALTMRGAMLHFTVQTSASSLALRTPVSGHFSAAQPIRLSADL